MISLTLLVEIPAAVTEAAVVAAVGVV